MKLIPLFAISVLLFIRSVEISHAQTSTAPSVSLRTDLITPSPNAVALGKYGIVPVSLYTGIPNISIPLGEAAGKEISVPISLGYHHNGLKTYEAASWVGLGWSLNAGGVISRVIEDKVDELTADTYNYENNIWKFSIGDVDPALLDGAVFKGTYDTEPDIYAFNFGNYSGKFIVYKGKTYQFPEQKLRISGNAYNGFTIITPEGTSYSFQETEQTIPKNEQSSYTVPTHNSSWYLSTIKPVDGKETITFSYATSPTALYSHSPISQSYQKYSSGNRVSDVIGTLHSPLPSRIYTKRLQSINTSKMSVFFFAQPGRRTDLGDSEEYALDQIVFSSNSGTIKAYKFNYNYFGSGGLTSLKLESLDELDKNRTASTAKRHAFVYNEATSNWPFQTSSVDHWGYANGARENGIILPNTLLPSIGMDREPHMAYSSLGMLKQIIYPTGGSSTFTFEPNVFANRVPEYQTVTRSVNAEIGRASASDNTLITQSRTFTLDTASTISLTYSRTPKAAVGTGPPNGPDDPTKDLTPEVTIQSYESFARSASQSATASTSLSYTIFYNRDNGGVSTTVKLPAGTYQAILSCDSKELGTSFTIGYKEKTNIPIEGIVGPGLRVKEITSYANEDVKSTPLLKKRYSYINRGGFSTGRMLKGGASYGGKNYTEQYYVGQAEMETVYELYNSSINSALGDLLDQEMYYSLVNEYQVSGTTDLRSQSEFVSMDDASIYSGTEVSPTRKIDYKKVGTDYVPVLKHEYKYDLVGDTLFARIKPYMSIQRIPSSGYGFYLPLREYSFDWYALTPKVWKYMTAEREVSYHGADSVVTQKTYVNDISSRRNLTAVKSVDSRGQEKITKYKYPADYDPSIAQPFIDRNLLSPVLEQQVWLKKTAGDSVLLFGKVDEYDLNLFKPKASYLLELSGPVSGPNQESKNSSGQYTTLLSDNQYKIRISNDYEASSGNLLAQDLLSRTSTKQVSYIWGYPSGEGKNTYPVAECKNGSLADFFYTGFEYPGTNIQTGAAHTGLNYYAGNYALGFSIPNTALTYTYSYWYRTGATWNYSGEIIYTGPVTLTGEAFDDIRVYPANGEMTTYTYFPEIGLSSSTDAKGQTTYFEYDSFERLTATKDQNGNLIKAYDYHYVAASNAGVTPITCTGEGQKLINGACETGVKFYDKSVYNSGPKNYTCTYHYVWSDGSVSGAFTETRTTACNIS